MKRLSNMVYVLTFLICLLASLSFAKPASPKEIETTLAKNSIDIECTFDVADISFEKFAGYELPRLKGAILPEDTAGSPWLPAKFFNVLIPKGSRVDRIEATLVNEVLVRDNIEIAPVQPPHHSNNTSVSFTEKNIEAYRATKKIPTDSAKLLASHVARGSSYVSIRVNPVRYVPAKKQLFLATDIKLSLVLSNVVAMQDNTSKKHISPTKAKNDRNFKDMLKQIVVNPGILESTSDVEAETKSNQTQDDEPATDASAQSSSPQTLEANEESGSIDYLIITSSALANEFENLASHRSSYSGWTSKVITLESIYANPDYDGIDAQEEIRNCIKHYVDNDGTLFVVLGGDDTVVPKRDCYVAVGDEVEAHMPTDLYYAGLDGNWDGDGDGIYGEAITSVGDEADLAADVFVGRIPVRTAAQASAYINKLISFEQNPPAESFKKKILVGGNMLADIYADSDRPSDTLNDGHLGFQEHSPVSDSEMWSRRLYRDCIQPLLEDAQLGYMFDSLTSWDTSSSGDYTLSAANLSTVFNQGWYNVNYSSHGYKDHLAMENGSFDANSILALTGNTTIFYTTACLTGYFDGDTDPCVSEAFLRNPNGGALAYFGSSRYGWFTPDPFTASNTSLGGTSSEFAREFYSQLYYGDDILLAKIFYKHKEKFIQQAQGNTTYRWLEYSLNYQGDPGISISDLENNPPRAHNDSANTAVGIAITIDVLNNDVDADGDTLSIASVQNPSHGSVSFNSDSILYTPETGWTGSDSFTYTISDGNGESDTATVTVTIETTTFLAHFNDNSSFDINPNNKDFALGSGEATVYGAPTWDTGFFSSSSPANKAVCFTSSDDLLRYSDGAGNIDYASHTEGGMTIGCWHKIVGSGNLSTRIFSLTAGMDHIDLSYGKSQPGLAQFDFCDDFESWVTVDSQTDTSAYIGDWIYFALTIDLSNHRCILRQYSSSGVLLATDMTDVDIIGFALNDDSGSKINLGGQLSDDVDKSLIDEFSLDNYVLTAAQIQERVDAMVAGTQLSSNPNFATGPTPQNFATNVSTNAVLSWTNGGLAVSHDIYIGNDKAELALADRNSPLYKGNIPSTAPSTYTPQLGYGANYYWRVDAVDHSGVAKWQGQIWSFTTGKTEFNVTGDLNGDDIVDISDLNIFASQWLNAPGCPTPECADFNGVNGVNLDDLAALIANWHNQPN